MSNQEVTEDVRQSSKELSRTAYVAKTGLVLFAEPSGRHGFWRISAKGGNQRVPEKIGNQLFTTEGLANKEIERYFASDWNPTQLSPKNRTVEKTKEKREPNATASSRKR